MTKGVEVMLGNPKKALISMAIPVAIANIAQTINNLIDTVWLSGLGPSALAAVGVVFPFFFIMIAVGNGIGVGSSQALARRIGAFDRPGVNKVASQAFVMTIVVSIITGALLTIFSEPLMIIGGAGDYLQQCLEYCVPIFIGTPAILLGGLFSALLRSEGAAKRSMRIHLAGAGLNIILDPIFIYGLNMGITGAAIATILSMAMPLLVSFYWYFGKKDTFARIPLKGFRFDLHLDWDILRVGIPASLELVLISIVAIFVNNILLQVDPVNGVAIYNTGWKILDLVMIPVMSIGFAVVPICAAALGAHRVDKIKDTVFLAVKYGIIIMVVLGAICVITAPWIVCLFTYSENSAALADDIVTFIRIGCVFLVFLPFSFTASNLFQSLGMGLKSLINSAFVNFVRLPICIPLISLGSLTAIWWGITAAEILGALVALVWGGICLYKLINGKYPKLTPWLVEEKTEKQD